MSDLERAWRVEEACLNAWPSPRQLLVHGYLLRAAGGPSKRQNSLNPMRGSGAPGPAVDAARAIFGRLGQRAIFRIPAIAPGLESWLAGGDYAVVDETCTLFRDLDAPAGAPDPSVAVAAAPGADWLALRDTMNHADAAAGRVFRDTVAALVLPRAFAAAAAEGGIGAIAFGVLDREWLVIESVAVPAPLRGRVVHAHAADGGGVAGRGHRRGPPDDPLRRRPLAARRAVLRARPRHAPARRGRRAHGDLHVARRRRRRQRGSRHG